MRLKVCVWRRANPHSRDCNVQDPAGALGWKEQPPPPPAPAPAAAAPSPGIMELHGEQEIRKDGG